MTTIHQEPSGSQNSRVREIRRSHSRVELQPTQGREISDNHGIRAHSLHRQTGRALEGVTSFPRTDLSTIRRDGLQLRQDEPRTPPPYRTSLTGNNTSLSQTVSPTVLCHECQSIVGIHTFCSTCGHRVCQRCLSSAQQAMETGGMLARDMANYPNMVAIPGFGQGQHRPTDNSVQQCIHGGQGWHPQPSSGVPARPADMGNQFNPLQGTLFEGLNNVAVSGKPDPFR